MALTMTPSTAAAMRAVPVDKAGVGSAVLNAAARSAARSASPLMGAILAHEVGNRSSRTGRRRPRRSSTASPRRSSSRRSSPSPGAVVAAVLVRHEVHEERPVPPLAEPEPAR